MSSHNAFAAAVQGPWQGETKIVVGIDIGTTQSGVAFTFLQKNSKTIFHRVTQWPGQESRDQQSKIPTLVWYDQSGQAVSFGAEALSHEVKDEAEDNGWMLAKHFKLHLHPDEMKAKYNIKIDPLPTRVSLRRVYTDFLRYLMKHTRESFENRIVGDRRIWSNYQSRMEVVIAHPNGWGMREQTFLREVAIDAGWTSASSPQNIQFVTEGEASAHFCIHHTTLGSQLQPGKKFVVCDAGGSTVDTTVYSVVSTRPKLEIKEARASACVQAGGIFVNLAAEEYLRSVFRNASIGQEDTEAYTEKGMEDFEGSAKRKFQNSWEDTMIEIAGTRMNNSSIRVRCGRMTIPGTVVKSLFDVSLNQVKPSVDQQLQGVAVSYMLIVGGFGDSPFLQQELKTRAKAVADGAVIWNVASSVVGRAPRYSFGGIVLKNHEPASPEFQGRKTFVQPSGKSAVNGGWSQIVHKGVVLSIGDIARQSYSSEYSTGSPDLEDFSDKVYSYSREDCPDWLQDKRGGLLSGFKEICALKADMSGLSGALQYHVGALGVGYWEITFDVCIQFGGTELLAYLEWKENGITRKGKVEIISSEHI